MSWRWVSGWLRSAHRGVEGPDADVERLRTQADPQLAVEDLLEYVDLSESSGPVARGQQRLGDPVGRVEPDQLDPAAGPAQQVTVQELRALPRLERPRRVEVLGQQIPTP